MAEQRIYFGSGGSLSATAFLLRSPNPLISRGLRSTSTARYFSGLTVHGGSGVVGLRFGASADTSYANAREDLSSLFETGGSITITVSGASVTLLMGGDASGPYSIGGAANQALGKAWFGALVAPITSASLTLRDFVPSTVVPLAGRLTTALTVAAVAPVAVAPVPAVPLAGRLTAALSVSSAAPRATDASVVLDAEQFIDLGVPNRFTDRAIGWDSISFRIDDSLAPRSRWLRGMVVFGRTGAANLNFEADATQVSQFRADLLEKFESNGSITITANGDSVTLDVVDDADPYFFSGADNQALGKAWFDALVGPITSASLTLRDFVPSTVVPLAGRLAVALSVAATAPVAVAPDAVPLAGRLSAALTVAADAPVAVAPAAVPLAARLTTALTVAASAPVAVGAAAVPLAGRLATALTVAAVAPDRVAPDAVPLVGRLSAALSVVASAPVAAPPVAVPLAARLTTALTVAASAPVAASLLVLTDSDDTDLVVVAKALLVASGPGASVSTIYADSDRGGSGSPLAGELGLGDGNTLISRFRRISTTELLINDDDDPTALTLSAYFGSGGAGADLTLYFQTLADGEISFAVSSQYVGAGGGFVRFTLPADARALFDGIATGDRFIFKAARPLAVAVPLAGRLATALSVAATAPDRVAPDAVPLVARLTTALTVAASAPVAVGAAAVPLTGRLATALSVVAVAPDRVAPDAVPLVGRLATALSVAASAPVAVGAAAVPLTGRLSVALSVSANAPVDVSAAAVPLVARLTTALTVAASAPVLAAAIRPAGRLATALSVLANAPVVAAAAAHDPGYRAARDARSLSGRAQVFALEAHHSGLAAPIRIVADNKEHTVAGETYIPCAFSAVPPQSVDGEVRQAHLRIDNVGEKMMTWVNVSRGGRGASVRVMSLIAAVPGETESTIDYEFEMDVGVAEVTNEQISITLTDEPTVGRPAITLRHDPLVSPGLFSG